MNSIQHTSAEQICNALPKGRRIKPDEYKACCPAHDDNSPSLSISQKSGSVLVYCWSGCSQSDVLDALRSMGIWAEKGEKPRQRGFTQEQREYMVLWVMSYRDNTAKGYEPTLEERNKNTRYRRVLSEIANG